MNGSIACSKDAAKWSEKLSSASITVMTEQEALTRAWPVLEKEGCRDAVAKVSTIHFSTARERREVLGQDHPDNPDYWYIDSALKLDEGVVS